ncbi:hypothetical protein P9112_001913 [Eukaryota sp. TZLM1-RC]
MEKYREFADPNTDVNPFTEITTPGSGRESILLRIIKFPFRLGFNGTRFVLFCIILMWLHIAYLTSKLFRILPFGQRIVLRYLHTIGLKALLFLLGCPNPKYKSNREQVFGQEPNLKPPHISPQTLLLSTFSSPLDPLVLSLKHSPFFAFPLLNNPTLVHSYSLSRLLLQWTFPFLQRPNPQTLTAALKTAQKNRSPLVLFPEIVPTNGRGVLGFDLRIPEDFPCREVCFVSATYSHSRKQKHSPTWPMFQKTFILKMFNLVCQFNNCLCIYSDPFSFSELGDDVTKFSQDQLADLQGSLGLSIGADVGFKYLEYHKQIGSGRKRKGL